MLGKLEKHESLYFSSKFEREKATCWKNSKILIPLKSEKENKIGGQAIFQWFIDPKFSVMNSFKTTYMLRDIETGTLWTKEKCSYKRYVLLKSPESVETIDQYLVTVLTAVLKKMSETCEFGTLKKLPHQR